MSLTTAPLGAVRRCLAAAVLLAPALFGCATPPTDPAERAAFEQTNDPLEPANRKILEANMVLDTVLLRPLAKIYVTIVPEDARDAARRALDNLKEPVLAVNNVLQGRLDGAGITVGRFAVNSTVGVVGLMDIAKKWGMERQPADFGQTLYVWGIPDGPYLMLPVFGPSDVRDAIGIGVDAYIDPLSYLATKEHLDGLQIGRYVLDGIDQRAQALDVLDDLQKNSLDFYAELRSLSQQHRATELRRGESAAPGANFYADPAKPGGTQPPPSAKPVAAPATPPDLYHDPARSPGKSPARSNAARNPPVPAPKPQPPVALAPAPAPAPAPVASNAVNFDEGPLRGSARP